MNKLIVLIGLLTIALQNNAQTVMDVDGNTYNTVTIGTQVWMRENLKTTTYNDNTPIPNITSLSAWISTYSPAYCWNNFDISTYKATYGALYNWYAINTDKLCPLGWHVPSYAEFDALITYLGGTGVAGGKLKEAGTAHWKSPNQGADNSSGFTGLPGGLLDPVNMPANFHLFGGDANWWSSSSNTSSEAWYILLAMYVQSTSFSSADKRWGFSVRCIKDNNSTEQVTVTFDVDGGSTVPILVTNINTTIAKPTDPAKAGYTFAGWYKEASCTNAWNFTIDVVTTNIMLFAKWISTTSVEDQHAADFRLYPNPAKNILHINLNSPDACGAIFDVQGKRVMEIKSGETQIDISNLSKGVYFVKIISSENIIVNKLIIE